MVWNRNEEKESSEKENQRSEEEMTGKQKEREPKTERNKFCR
jgi:hypothetical protein